jgi:hypothetical protein
VKALLVAASLVLLAGCSAGTSYDSGAEDPPAFSDSGSDVDSGSSPDDDAVEPPPAEEPAPPPAPPAASFAKGDPFDQSCSVAWPSAPVVTSDVIQITAFCPNVPSTYPLVLIQYSDPTLPLNPSTGSFRVVGTVYGSATSDAGMPYLIVIADQVQL